MSTVQRVWISVASVVALVGIALAWFSFPIKAMMLAVGAAIVAWTVLNLRPVVPPSARIAKVALNTSIAAVAVIGLVSVAGMLGLTVVCLVGITAPPTVAAARTLQDRWRYSSDSRVRPSVELPSPEQRPGSGQSGADQERSACWDPAPVGAMTDVELCRAWRASYTSLQLLPYRDHLLIVSFRAAVLDELQTRYPQGFIRWINDGARAAGNPARYLTSAYEQAEGTRPEDGPPGS